MSVPALLQNTRPKPLDSIINVPAQMRHHLPPFIKRYALDKCHRILFLNFRT